MYNEKTVVRPIREYFTEDTQKQLSSDLLEADKVDFIIPSDDMNPYIECFEVRKTRKYNPNFGDNKVCECGDPYYRHFDSYEDMEPCGCKYCPCSTFIEKKEEEEEEDNEHS